MGCKKLKSRKKSENFFLYLLFPISYSRLLPFASCLLPKSGKILDTTQIGLLLLIAATAKINNNPQK
jgi:hypothetical protein